MTNDRILLYSSFYIEERFDLIKKNNASIVISRMTDLIVAFKIVMSSFVTQHNTVSNEFLLGHHVSLLSKMELHMEHAEHREQLTFYKTPLFKSISVVSMISKISQLY